MVAASVDGRAATALPPGSSPGLRGRASAPPLEHFPEGRAFQKPGESRPSGK